MRHILTRALTALIAVLLLVLLGTTVVLAESPAQWVSDDKISYEGDTFNKQTADGTNPPILNQNQVYYLHSSVTDAFSGSGERQIIYFDDGIDMNTVNNANLIIYQVDGSGNYGNRISGPTDIDLVPRALSSTSNQASWSQGNLIFDGRTYQSENGSPFIADGTSAPKLPNGTQYYQARGSPDAVGNGTLHVIYFPAGADITTATSASYATFSINGSGTVGSQTGSTTTINVVPISAFEANGVGEAATDEAAGTSCGVEGIGWIVCPVSNFLSWGMDSIFDLLKGFLEVEPLSTQTDSPLYQAWNAIRSIANIAFVIAFLIIIYSQISGIGISNYSIKNLLPRLIIAAILVNLSYLICAIAVDLSNVAGSGLDQILIGLRENLSAPNTEVPSWESVTSFMLATGTGVVAGGIALGGITIASGASLGAALILLLPILLSLIIAALVAFLVLAARQALIILLIIIAPLAFVAYLLPNTEKLFEKWRSIFTTMLVFFPIFALIFGGSQLAAALIMSNASGDNALNMILLAMFVQVAPLVITPLLVRFSGGIIGRIAGIINDPKKGLIDRTRNFAKSQSEYMAARNMARQDPVRRRQVFRRFALGSDQMRRSREDRLTAYKESSDARWTNSQAYSNIQQDLQYAQEEKALGTERASLRYEQSRTVAGNVQNLDLQSRDTKLRVENVKALRDIQWESNHSTPVVEQRMLQQVRKDQLAAVHSTHDAEYEELKFGRLGGLPATGAMGAMMRQSQQDSRLLAINAMRAESAKRAVNERFTAELEANTQRIDGQLMQAYAGGVQGFAGSQRALANAIKASANAHNEAVANAAAILSHTNLPEAEIRQLSLGISGGSRVALTEEMQLAATEHIAGGKNASEIINLIREIDLNPSPANQDLRQTFVDALMTKGMRPKFMGANWAENAKQGIAPLPGKARLDAMVAERINGNHYGSAETLVSEDKDFLGVVRDTLVNNLSTTPISPVAKADIKRAIDMARTDHRFSGRIADRKDVLDDIYRNL